MAADPNNREDIEAETVVKSIVICTLRLSQSPEDLTTDLRLLDGGLGLDSLSGLKIITSIEQHFGFMFEVHEITRESLQTVGSLIALVERKTGSQAP